MEIKTNTLEDTDKFMELVNASLQVKKIRKIVNNRRSHSEQIKAIKQLLTPKEK